MRMDKTDQGLRSRGWGLVYAWGRVYEIEARCSMALMTTRDCRTCRGGRLLDNPWNADGLGWGCLHRLVEK